MRLQVIFSLASASSPFIYSVCSGQRTQGAKIEFVAIRGLEGKPCPTGIQQEIRVLGAGVPCDCGELSRYMMLNMERPDGVRGSGGFGLRF